MTDLARDPSGKIVPAEQRYQKRTAAAQERIAAALERLADAFIAETTAAAGEPVCGHPIEARTDLSTMGRPRWRCDPNKGGCGFSVGMEEE